MSPDEATIVQRARLQVENTIRNLKRTGELRHALPRWEGDPWFTAFVVGAGPSLDRNGHLLFEAAQRGVVLCVNTSLGAVAKHTDQAECVALENVDVSAHLQHPSRGVTAAISSHPRVFNEAIRTGGGWFFDCSPHMLGIARVMGVDSLPHSGSALTAAVTYAKWLGARRIVLVGCDLGFSGSKAYASGAGWDGIEVSREGDRLRFSGREDRDEMHRGCGVPPVARLPKTYTVPGWGGGEVDTKLDYLMQSDWLASFAICSELVCINATEGGISIPKWEEVRLDEAIDRTPTGPTRIVDEQRVDGAVGLAEVRAQVGRARAYLRSLEASEPDFSAAVEGFPMVEAMAAADLIMLNRRPMEYQVKNRAIYSVLGAAVDEVERVLND